MPLTTVADVRRILAPTLSQALSDTEIAAFIADAATIVAQYPLARRGTASESSTGMLIDHNARYLDWVRPGARVTHCASGRSTTVQEVLNHTQLILADPAFQFFARQAYKIEDLAARERAERYKTASLIFLKLSPLAQGWESVRLGPAAASTGSWDDLEENNVYEAEFRQIVDYFVVAV